jgi:hypothetical protein
MSAISIKLANLSHPKPQSKFTIKHLSAKMIITYGTDNSAPNSYTKCYITVMLQKLGFKNLHTKCQHCNPSMLPCNFSLSRQPSTSCPEYNIQSTSYDKIITNNSKYSQYNLVSIHSIKALLCAIHTLLASPWPPRSR